MPKPSYFSFFLSNFAESLSYFFEFALVCLGSYLGPSALHRGHSQLTFSLEFVPKAFFIVSSSQFKCVCKKTKRKKNSNKSNIHSEQKHLMVQLSLPSLIFSYPLNRLPIYRRCRIESTPFHRCCIHQSRLASRTSRNASLNIYSRRPRTYLLFLQCSLASLVSCHYHACCQGRANAIALSPADRTGFDKYFQIYEPKFHCCWHYLGGCYCQLRFILCFLYPDATTLSSCTSLMFRWVLCSSFV